LTQSADSLENEQLEIKWWCHDDHKLTEKIVDAASCLANAMGGVVLVGVAEEANIPKFSLCPRSTVTPSWLVARVQDNTHPPVKCRALDVTDVLSSVRGTATAQVFALIVERTTCLTGHVTAKGIARIRVGKECKPHFVAEDDRSEAPVPGLTVDHLSGDSVNWAIAHHKRRFTAGEAFLDAEDFLVRSRLLTPQTGCADGGVTLAALLLFGKQAALAQFAPHCETIIQTPTGDLRLRKNIIESLREIVLGEHSVLHRCCPTLDELTLRELLVNAYVHRCWRTNGPIMITISDERLEIQNPGDLLPGLHVDSLIYCTPVYRNLLLAEGVRFAGLADRIGQGIDIIFKTVIQGGFDFPVLESADSSFRATIPLTRSEEFRAFVRRRGASLSLLDELVVLRYLWDHTQASIEQLAKALQRGKDLTQRVLASMQKKSMIEISYTDETRFCLSQGVHHDIKTIFSSDQLGLFGDGP
jgi:ATP-dependent DNA helicase RecG